MVLYACKGIGKFYLLQRLTVEECTLAYNLNRGWNSECGEAAAAGECLVAYALEIAININGGEASAILKGIITYTAGTLYLDVGDNP